MTEEQYSKPNEENMYFAWLLHDKTNCPRCRAKIKLYYEWHYGLRVIKELSA